MKRVLVMGGSYFIGKHVVDRLKNTFHVTVFNRGTRPFNDEKIIELYGDRNHLESIQQQLHGRHFDYVIDVSGLTLDHAKILVDALDCPNIKKFVYISSSAVYTTNQASIPYKEDDSLGGNSPFQRYADDKIAAEKFLQSIFEPSTLTIFRPPYVYGEDNYILREKLIFYLLDNNLPIFYPKENNLLQFIYVKDLAEAIFQVLNNHIPASIYNLGDPPIYVKEWLELCARVSKKKPLLVPVEAEKHQLNVVDFFPFFAMNIVLSTKKIDTFLKSLTPLEVGLKRAYKDYQNYRHAIVLPTRTTQVFKVLSKHYIDK